MNVEEVKEIAIWQAVILQAAIDMATDNGNKICGAKQVYAWSKTEDCEEVCEYAQMNYGVVKIGFAKIYLKHLNKQITKFKSGEKVINKLTKKEFTEAEKLTIINELELTKKDVLITLSKLEKGLL